MDIGGCEKAKDAIKEIIDYIKNPEIFIKAGVKMPKGVLLYGPPGTGKTLIAKAAAAEAGIPVIYTSGSEFVEVFVGLGAKRIREIFKQAREQSPCMIFIDEIDAVGYSRGNNNFIQGGGHRELETTLNQLLNEMDGFEENDRIVVVAATNLASTLDPALLRPGRFDRKVEVTLPNSLDRREIFKIHLKNKSHSLTDEHLTKAAANTDGLAGAEIENIVNLAALNSVRKAHALKQSQSSLTGHELLEYVQEFLEEKRKTRVSNSLGAPNYFNMA
jgi:cell division protease FtsH